MEKRPPAMRLALRPTTAPGSKALSPMAWKYQRSASGQRMCAPSHCAKARQRQAETMLEAIAAPKPAASHQPLAARRRAHSAAGSAK